MKIFISWSGRLSHEIAILLKGWLPSVIQSIEPYVSSEDIDKGARWLTDISGELETSSFGILCLTRSNLNAPWILFEAGALSKKLEKSKVCPLLIDLSHSDIEGPLVQFQATSINKEDISKLLRSINQSLDDKGLGEKQLEETFDMWWPKFDKPVKELISKTEDKTEKKKTRPEGEVIEEILQLNRTMLQMLSKLESRPSEAAKVHDVFPPSWSQEYINEVLKYLNHKTLSSGSVDLATIFGLPPQKKTDTKKQIEDTKEFGEKEK